MDTQLAHNAQTLLGTWEGTHRFLDAHGKETEVLRVRVSVTEADGTLTREEHATWEDGRVETTELTGTVEGDTVRWNGTGQTGTAHPAGKRTAVVHWTRAGEPGLAITELVSVGEADDVRARTQHWSRGGAVFARTLVDERRLS